MERVAAVVVTYNRKELLAQCIEALLSQQNAVCDILIVDNASTDGTGAYLAALNEPRVHSRSTGANLGGAGGFNFGMRWAVEAGYDLVWIMTTTPCPTRTVWPSCWPPIHVWAETTASSPAPCCGRTAPNAR